MKPGRELDALVAEKVMGQPMPDEPPTYSTDISAAWTVVPLITTGVYIWMDITVTFQGVAVCLRPHPCEEDRVDPIQLNVDPREVSDTATPSDPEVSAYTICLAALKAVGEDLTDD